ncbi:MAG: class B sortase [Lachnospiraceae bacterium]|nr:class B sortase [Lachnospiraceae bacterium]
MKKKVRIFFIIILCCVFVYSIFNVVKSYLEYKEAEDIYAQAEERFITFLPEEPALELMESKEKHEENAAPSSKDPLLPDNISVDFESLKKINSEVIGWIYVPETVISYPLLQGKDNNHYLYYAYQGTYNSSGSIFMDYRNSSDLSDPRTLIYGHNMLNGSQFTVLKKYSGQDFYETHPRFYIITETGYLAYDIFSAHRAHTLSDVYQSDTSTEEGFSAFLSFAVKNSDIDTGIEVGTKDKIVTLSTCTSYEINERFVVHGKLVEDTRKDITADTQGTSGE